MSRSHRQLDMIRTRRSGGFRGKHGVASEYRRERHDKDFLNDPEDARVNESMKLRYNRDYQKELHVSFRSLNRFLDKFVGQEWDFVYSKLRRKFKNNDYVSRMIINMINRYMVTESEHIPNDFIIRDGILCRN